MYETLPGWEEDISGCRSWDDLPEKAQRYFERVEELVGVPVSIISVVLTIGLLELSLAIFFPVPFSIEQNMYFEPDPYTGYRLRANSIGSFRSGKIPASTNRHGHRSETTDPLG